MRFAGLAGALFGLAVPKLLVAAELPRLGTCGVAAGGFLLPGTEACLKVGGFVRAEGAWSSASPSFAFAVPASSAPLRRPAAALDRSAIGASARLSADLHLPTELGPVRVFVSLRGRNGVATDRAER